MTDDHALYDKLGFERAYERARKRPLDLEPRDFVLLHAFGSPGLDDDAYDARRRAILALLPSIPPATKRLNPSPAPTTSPLAKYFDRYSDALVQALKPVFERYQTKLAALEQRNAALDEKYRALESRLLELEAAVLIAPEPRGGCPVNNVHAQAARALDVMLEGPVSQV